MIFTDSRVTYTLNLSIVIFKETALLYGFILGLSYEYTWNQRALGMQTESAHLFPGHPDPNNHTETLLIPTLFGQCLGHISS